MTRVAPASVESVRKSDLRWRRFLDELVAPVHGYHHCVHLGPQLLDVADHRIRFSLCVRRYVFEVLSWPQGVAEKTDAQPVLGDDYGLCMQRRCIRSETAALDAGVL